MIFCNMSLRARLLSAVGIFALALTTVAWTSSMVDAQGKPGSSVIELCPPITTATVNVTSVAPVPLGTQIRVGARLINVLKVSNAGGAGTLTVYFQYSADDGQTWNDFAAPQSSNSAGTWYVPVSTIVAGPTSALASVSDGALTANTAVQGPIGDRLRIKYTVAGNPTTPWSFQAFVLPD
jgi:hypothetical protein